MPLPFISYVNFDQAQDFAEEKTDFDETQIKNKIVNQPLDSESINDLS